MLNASEILDRLIQRIKIFIARINLLVKIFCIKPIPPVSARNINKFEINLFS